MFTSRFVRVAAVSAALALPLSLAACGQDSGAPAPGAAPSSSAPAPVSSAPASPSMSESMSADQPFGAACSAVPKTGKGSFDGMSQDPVATAASNNPVLSTLVSAVKQAGLVDTLNNAKDVTVFAPTNDAFAKLDKKTLKQVMGDKKLLTSILTEHVVPETLTPETLAGEHKTLNSKQGVTVEGSGESFTVNSTAKIVCGNVKTANATVYIIDTVLTPQS